MDKAQARYRTLVLEGRVEDQGEVKAYRRYLFNLPLSDLVAEVTRLTGREQDSQDKMTLLGVARTALLPKEVQVAEVVDKVTTPRHIQVKNKTPRQQRQRPEQVKRTLPPQRVDVDRNSLVRLMFKTGDLTTLDILAKQLKHTDAKDFIRNAIGHYLKGYAESYLTPFGLDPMTLPPLTDEEGVEITNTTTAKQDAVEMARTLLKTANSITKD